LILKGSFAPDDLRNRVPQFLAVFGFVFFFGSASAENLDAIASVNHRYEHLGGGLFAAEGTRPIIIDLRKVEHEYDRGRDPDVPVYTNVTLPDITPDLYDRDGRPYALITLYNIDPPLEDLPSREAGIDRGLDFRDPSNLIKSVYSNYVSPVFTLDRERRPVSGHPIGHFYVRVQIPGYPTILTGMTTIGRADVELVDLTIGRKLGIGGVLLTPQPGRLNSAAEATEELNLRQSKLLVVDGLNYKSVSGRNIGPVFEIDDGNVTFARFKLPVENARDALDMFLGYLQRGEQNKFGSLLSRPHKGTGAGCAAFAMSWLKGSGVIPVVDESWINDFVRGSLSQGDHPQPFWTKFHRTINIPWDHIGCDDRVGLASQPEPAAYTVHDALFHGVSDENVRTAIEGLAEKIRRDSGAVVGTLFSVGALSPLRGLVIAAKRNDPDDTGDYEWSATREGLNVGFWDNGLFSDWIKQLWKQETPSETLEQQGLTLVREGRFRGVEVDAMDVPRQLAPFFDQASELESQKTAPAEQGIAPTSCRSVFTEAGLQ
jgi:hypothetical protein